MSEKQWKGVFLVKDRKCFALSDFISTNQKQVFGSISSNIKVVSVANYHITIKRDFGNPNFISTTIAVYSFLQLYHFLAEKPQIFTYSN